MIYQATIRAALLLGARDLSMLENPIFELEFTATPGLYWKIMIWAGTEPHHHSEGFDLQPYMLYVMCNRFLVAIVHPTDDGVWLGDAATNSAQYLADLAVITPKGAPHEKD